MPTLLHRLALLTTALLAIPTYKLWKYAHQPQPEDPMPETDLMGREPLVRLYVVYVDDHPLLMLQAPDDTPQEKILAGVHAQIRFAKGTSVKIKAERDVPTDVLQRLQLLYQLRIIVAGITTANAGPGMIVRPGERH